MLNRISKTLVIVALLAMGGTSSLDAQAFLSTQSANLPTTTMLRPGNWMFEVSHRFDLPISQGADALWGFDGPASLRLGFMHQPTESLLLGVVRSNLNDNLELNAKLGLGAMGDGDSPVHVAVQGGIAWNTQPPIGTNVTDNEMQAYGQLILNTSLGERFAVGAVPSVIYNPRLADPDAETALALGLNAQFYTDGALSFFGEWILVEEVVGQPFDSGTFGIELRTRGHFFKILVTNQSSPGMTQLLPGSTLDFTDANTWSVGFNITRLLPF